MAIYWNDGTSLYHYGIKGQRWGDRRYQNEDGTYTEEGRRRYGIGDGRTYKKLNGTKASSGNPVSRSRKGIDVNKAKNAAKIALGVLGTAAVAGVTYAYFKNEQNAQTKVNQLVDELEYRKGKMDVYSLAAEQLLSERNKAIEEANSSNGSRKLWALNQAARIGEAAYESTQKAIHEGKQGKAVIKELDKLDPKHKRRYKYEQKKKALKGVNTFTPNRTYIDRFIPD